MSFLRFLFAPRPASDDAARAHALEEWEATGVVPVAHMVADLGAMGDATGEFELPGAVAVGAGTRYSASGAWEPPPPITTPPITSCHRPCRLSPQTCACALLGR